MIRFGSPSETILGPLNPRHVPALWLLLSGIGLVAFPAYVVVARDFGYDAHAYWSFDLAHPYSRMVALEAFDSFLYSPPIAFVMSPFHLLPWPIFLGAWTALLYLAVGWLGRAWWALALVAFAPVAMELHYGNINLLLAVAVAGSFRWPALWTIVLLTKPTAAIGLLYPLLRGNWRAVAIPLLITGVICAASAVLRPDLWVGYFGMISDAAGIQELVPLAWRLPVAAIVVVWGAWANRPWTVPVAAAIAMPQSWWTNFAILTALPRVLETPPFRGPSTGPALERAARAAGNPSN
jgi:hypothetical protein